jgi:hypothetical protein
MPRSAIMITTSLKTHLEARVPIDARVPSDARVPRDAQMMICPSKCHPVNTVSIWLNCCIPHLRRRGRVCTRAAGSSNHRVGDPIGVGVEEIDPGMGRVLGREGPDSSGTSRGNRFVPMKRNRAKEEACWPTTKCSRQSNPIKSQRAIACNGLREKWQSWQIRQRRIYRL